jgi:ribosomal protein L40E
MASARIFAAKKRLIRATRLKRVKRQYWFLRDKQWETGWAFLLGEYHRFRREAAQRIQGAFRASVAKGIVQKARRWKAIHMLQPWWRGTWARMFTVANLKQQRRVEQLTRRVMARMKYSGLLYTLHTWHANVVEIKLNRDRLFLLRQIADQKWVRCCAIRIQASWRRFYYTQINGAHHIHSVEFSPASLRIQKLRKQLHPRLVQLVSQLEKTGNADEFAIDLLGSVEMWQNPEQSIILASKIELGNRIPLEPLPLQKMQEWIENTMKRTLLWRPQPLDCIGFTDKDEGPHDHQACRCNPFARVSLHRAGFCRGKIGLPHVIWFPFIHVVQKYFQAVEKMREIQRDVVQALQEKRMMETLGCLILADTSDRGNRFGHTHTRWSKKSVITRSRMNNRALKRDNKQHDYIRWFVKDVDTCAKCNALLSWKAANGKCQVCNTSRLQAPTMSSTLQSKLLLPPLGSRRGVKSRKGLSGVGDIEESINELIYHASFCCYAPAGHWRRLMPKWKVWEESRIHLAEPTRKVLLIYNISTIGSLWLSKISGQLESIPELNDEIVQKLCRLMEFLSDYIMGELLAPEDDQEMYNEKYGRDLVNEFRERRVGYYENP